MNLDTEYDIELRVLEDMFEHEAECQSREHLTTCSEEVTHHFVSKHRDILVCADTADYVNTFARLGKKCGICLKPIVSCWTITPI